ncbi:potassium channel family protein [Aquipseudomonas ullengensis]|uniref:Two pore domain potassium channel family protein n=1 Tax=Aquipseudomonas ullengensis TaxID=2759166 RepID=A0A7W4QBC5_9GAMM|nr:potassium channel family protein [Pseudomonas ullengensis]MBB2496544.1 two pore domain potassium channel family protein [Pseudomonas ullengensis]
MLLNLLIGLPMTVLCLLLQAVMVALSLRRYVEYRHGLSQPSPGSTTLILALVMLFLLFGNFLQMALWAGLFVALDEFQSFSQALYFSGVTFATLGYGDLVLSPPRQLLSALEAANGILMFGVSTAVMTAALSDVLKHYVRDHFHAKAD